MSKPYIEITEELKTKRISVDAMRKTIETLKNTPSVSKDAFSKVLSVLSALNREVDSLERQRFDAYNRERNHSPLNQEVFNDIIQEVKSTPFRKPGGTSWGKWELSFIADYIEENYVRR